MATTTHTDVFDPQTEADFARIEADAAEAARAERRRKVVTIGESIDGTYYVQTAWFTSQSADIVEREFVNDLTKDAAIVAALKEMI